MDSVYKLTREEIRTLKLFLSLFFTTFFIYDVAYYYIMPKLEGGGDGGPILERGLGIWLYILIVILVFVGIYVAKRQNPYAVKYIIFIGYNILDFIHNFIIYYGTDLEFDAGNIVEGFFFLFAPLFVNKRYFWLVTGGTIVKYVLMGFIVNSFIVLIPIVLCSLFSIIGWIILLRFQSYIHTIEMTHKELQQSEKMAVIGRVATVIGFKMRNPLMLLNGFVRGQKEKYPEDKAYCDIMEQEIERIDTIATELVELGNSKPMECGNHNIKDILSYVVRIMGQSASERGIKIHTIYKGELPSITCNEKRLKQVFLNLIKNAIESMQDGGIIIIEVTLKDAMIIRIKDEGCGIPKDKMPKLSEAFYTTKDDGTGLGLMVTYKIIEEHQGKIQFESEVGVGTTVEIVLPIH
ncbi:sensor histidine kinase [Bacillus pseudomycoides]|uniref:ATP-binding protein n=1 Tax=Bacillus pseudomycoides TaxID=64104 RepID=UPI000BFA1930|nr:ATP-binding protein [Bacillus pseudomycoides]PGA94659.1 sensor histidine kinase [Bacillus pseudomycoides]PHF44112.1 sensor histidine kinase [Bacillus pseudomycoides]